MLKNQPKRISEITNTRLFMNRDNSVEIVVSNSGWGTKRGSYSKRAQSRCLRGASVNYEQNRLKTIKKAKTKVRRLILQYGFAYLYTLEFATSIGIRDGDSKTRELRRKLKNSCTSFKDYILTRAFDENDLLYYKLISNVPLPINTNISTLWKYGSVSLKTYDNRIYDLHGEFTESFKDKRFEGYRLYSPAKSTTLEYEEAYFDSVNDIKSYMASRYPRLKKSYEKNYRDANVTNLFFK